MNYGKVKVVANPKMNRGKRWVRRNTLHLPVIVTYLDRLGVERTRLILGSTKGHLFADKRTTILEVQVPVGAKTKIKKKLEMYGWSVE